MILRLRQAVPVLQNLSGWAAFTGPSVARRSVWASAASAASGEPGDEPQAPEAEPTKKKRRSTTGAASTSSSSSVAGSKSKSRSKTAAAVADTAESDDAAEAPPKPRASRRKIAKTAAEADAAAGAGEQPATNDGTADTAAPAGPAPVKAPRARRASKKDAAAAAAAPVDAAAGVDPAGEADSAATSTSTPAKKRSSRATTKKTAVADAAEEAGITIRSLPYEECLVLPRKAEALLGLLGLRHPLPSASSASRDSGARDRDDRHNPHGPAPQCLRSVQELAEYMGTPSYKEFAMPLLIAQYQDYMGPTPDLLYDLFKLDAGPSHLASQDVRAAVIQAGKDSLTPAISAKGTPPEALYKAVWANLERQVTRAAIDAQGEKYTSAQIELFLLDWASATQTGVEGHGTRTYLAQRSAALQLTSKSVLERLHQYTIKGATLRDLAAAGKRTTKLAQPMEALVEGLKAGVALDRARLLADFNLGEGAPLHEYLPDLQVLISDAVASAPEPGSSSFYATLREKLRHIRQLDKPLHEQEIRWEKEGEKDGTALTKAQLRVLFHLGRLDRFREEYEAKKKEQEAAGAGAGAGVGM